jgi:hypothetical protein
MYITTCQINLQPMVEVTTLHSFLQLLKSLPHPSPVSKLSCHVFATDFIRFLLCTVEPLLSLLHTIVSFPAVNNYVQHAIIHDLPCKCINSDNSVKSEGQNKEESVAQKGRKRFFP